MLDETKLFDFIKIMFTKPNDYKKITNHNKKRHHFMINRFFAIQYPSNAQFFNKNGINPSEEAISFFMERNEIGKREFKELEKFAKEDLYLTLQKLEDSMQVY
jgi:hypothetical protein